MLGGVFVLGTIIPIAINFAEQDKISAKFDSTISFTNDTKYGKYYDVGKNASPLTWNQMNEYWIKHANDTEMQLGEIIYGISKFLPTLSTITSYSYECTIYNYEHRVLQINSNTQIFEFKFWYEVKTNYHPKDPNFINYVSAYRFYIDWTTPEFLQADQQKQPGLYRILYSQYYTYTPVFDDWELRYTNCSVNSHSLVFATQEFA